MFKTELTITALDNRPGWFVLDKALVWEENNLATIVPKGFDTDLASIPRAFRWLLDQNGKSKKAAVLHDFMYRTGRLSRKAADDLFHRALIAEGVNPIGRWLYWAGVRLGGWAAYKARR